VPEWFPYIVTAVGGLIVATLSFFGGRYAVRQSTKAAAKTADVESRKVDVGEWQALLIEFKEQVKGLTLRVEKLEKAVIEKDARHLLLISYTRTVLAWVQRTMPGSHPPMPPAAFVDELAYITER